VQEIGRGNTGRVFLAVDYDGVACALKFYLDIEEEEAAKTKAREEYDLWTVLQSDYTEYVGWLELNEQAVLKMPVFVPLPPEARDYVLDSVRGMLLKFFDQGYLYNEVRWQHVGCRKKENGELDFELALLDLGSLRERKASEDESVIDEQISLLRQRKGTEPPAVAPGGLLGPVRSN
jgi:Family of unknown function (DUF5898)